MDFINDKKHLRLSGQMMDSKYYNYVLSATDVRVFTLLWHKVIVRSPYYNNGLLLVNIKQSTMSKYLCLSRSTVIRSINKLFKLGVVIPIRKRQNNNMYIIGIRTKGNEWLLFLYHLINKYEEMLTNIIDEEMDINDSIRAIQSPDSYRIDKDIKEYILRNFNKKSFFLKNIVDNKTISEVLFDRKDYYYRATLKVVNVSF